ncbi:MAG: hypothetical protein QF463_01340 [Vicinamibacterales bacterium]|jgi:hypothetical protein|nr:hypothetical protein [Acidobacteriota bacterium]MDP6372585.1 hypothetical protein [Vicinamibacterales bacterium]MBU22547.1 hypothetical protein [Acidobacteriota bacterium]MDP6607692.1 hypothetical protein [Vicinamibacterales bacterium]MDP7294782.1 hypothetical protein [Vicinamibacterales bacterium]|tara:strand:+ start:1105 stop:1857 length:753 start_codon:yes stop_codon:yes gene_type:complete
MSIIDDPSDANEPGRGGFGRTFRTFVIWLIVLGIAVGAGFAGGYVLHYQELRDLERASSEEQADLAAQLAALERQILEAEKEQLEAALARANVVANLDEVLTMLPRALQEIEQFGRAMQDIDTAQRALTDAGVTADTRDTLGASLAELRQRLTSLDLQARERIAASADDLEQVMSSSEGVQPPMAREPAHATEVPAIETPPADTALPDAELETEEADEVDVPPGADPPADPAVPETGQPPVVPPAQPPAD